jgi:tetratricopeptide (TPR) repeat protein
MMEARATAPIICPVLIGRGHDLAILRLLVERAKSGQGQVALVSGEAGIGKSRLVAEVKTSVASHDFRLLQGSCFPTDHAIPYAPLLDLLRSFLTGRTLAPPAPMIELAVPTFLPLLPDLGHVLPSAPPPPTLPSLDPEHEKRHRFEILAHFLSSQTDTHPLLLIVEDLHWSDETSLEFLHYLARRCAAERLLLLLTYRSDEVLPSLRHFLAQLDRERLAQEIALERLTREEVEAMLRAIFALPYSAHLELANPMYTLTEGNPFFVEETLKSLIMSGELFYANGRWQRKPQGELHIPRSVQDAVHQRTDRLSESARCVLTLAAVAGRRFDFALLQQLTGYDEQHLLVLMKELMAAQLIVEETAEQFAFRHALTRQAIYADPLVRERKALHRRIADAMECPSESSPGAHLADLAYHFYEAGAWEQAVAYGQRAGEQAFRLYAPHAAIEHLTRALDATQRAAIPPPTSLYRLRGRAYETLGDFEQAHADYKTALQMARRAGDRPAEWQALMDLGFLWTGRDYAKAGSYYQQALELARGMDEPLALAHCLNRLGNRYVNIGQCVEGMRYHQEALAIFQDVNDQHGTASTLDLLGLASLFNGDSVQAIAYYQQAAALFQQLDDRHGLVSPLMQLMVACGTDMTGPALLSLDESLHYGELALKIARGIGQREAEAHTLLNLGLVLGTRGEYARTLEVAQEGLSIAEQIEHRQWLTYGHWELGALYLELFDLPKAQQHLEQALTLAHEIGSEYWIHMASGFFALVSLAQQDVTRAESLLSAAPSCGAPTQTVGQFIICYARAELAQAIGDPGLALEIIDQLMASTSNPSRRQRIPRLSKVRGEALAALQRGDEAETALSAAQEDAHAKGLRPLLWRIFLAQGRLYQIQGRREEAEQAFSSARVLIEELAANVPGEHLREHFLSQAIALLPQKRSLRAGRASRQSFGGLTAREREVATLIAQGKTNRAIAEQLVLSERTIEGHVTNILTKLGSTTRTQIAMWVVEKGLARRDK